MKFVLLMDFDMEKCEECGFKGEFVREEYRDSTLVFCPDCYHLRIETCNHENNGLIKYSVGGGWRVQKICKECHTLFGNAISHAGVNVDKIQTIEKAKYDKYREDQDEKYRSRHNVLSDYHTEWRRNVARKNHQDYLKTMAWQEKREEVLKRDDYLCQACLKKRATQVHHLTYDHFGAEPLFDLISVCGECHQAITEMDQKRKSNIA